MRRGRRTFDGAIANASTTRVRLGLLAFAAAAAACSTDDASRPTKSRASAPTPPSSPSGPAPSSTAASPSAAAPRPGPLTPARILDVGKTVQVGDPWAATEKRVLAELGPSTRELRGLGHVWMAPGQDECTYFVMKYSGESVSEIVAPATHPRADRREFEACFWYVDQTPPDKDPSGPGPEPGKVYSVKDVLNGLARTRSKWVAIPIRMRGRTLSVVRSGPSADAYTNASMTLADENDHTVTMAAQVDQDVAAAPKDGQKVVVTVEGRIDGHAGWVEHAKLVK